MKRSIKIIKEVFLKKSIGRFIFWLILYRVLLDCCFYEYISPLWTNQGYGNYTVFQFNILIYCLSWVFLLISTIWSYLWYSSKDSSSLILLILYCISFIPFLSMMGFAIFPLMFCFSNLLYWFFLGLFHSFFKRIKTKSLYFKIGNDILFLPTIIIITVGMTIFLGYYSGFRIDLNLFNAYDYRSEAKSYSFPTYITYLLGLSRITVPLGIVYFIKKRRFIFFGIMIICAMINYSFDGGKTIFFISILAVLVGLFLKKRYINIVLPSFPILMIVGFIDYFYFTSFIFLFIIRRLLFVPNLINSYVYDYMLHNSPNYFSQLLRFLGIQLNKVDINYYIGATYFNSPLMSANSGLIADALWQLGYIGILLMPFIICLFLFIIDKTTSGVSNTILLIPCIIIAYYLNNSSITAALFSHGLVLFALIMTVHHRDSIFENLDVKSMRDFMKSYKSLDFKERFR